MTLAIYRTYRPLTFGDVTDQNHVKITIQNQIEHNTVAHAYLFSGPRGVGKTTIARLLAKSLNCTERKEKESEPCNNCDNCKEMNNGAALDVVEIDAASHTGVDNVRENIIESVRFAPGKGKYKVFIIDEVHMLSTSAFNALLKTLEEPPAHAVFILATTEIHKIPQTILSRCQRFDFKRIATPDLVARLQMIAKAEKVDVEEGVLHAIARLSEGCLRDAESLLGQILALGEKKIGKEEASIILPVTNTATVVDVMDAASRNDVSSVIGQLNQFVDQGGSVKHLTDELIDFVRTVLLSVLGGPVHDHYDASAMEVVSRVSKRLSPDQLAELLDALLAARIKPTHDALPHLPLEICFVRFCKEDANDDVSNAKNQTSNSEDKNQRPPQAPSKPQQKPPTSLSQPTAEPPQPPLETPATSSFTVEELKNKWKRCCEAVAKRNIALPLVLQTAEPREISGEEVTIGFRQKFHFQTINSPKNLTLLGEAISEIMQSAIRVKAIFLEAEEEKHLDTLAEAFGGKVVD